MDSEPVGFATAYHLPGATALIRECAKDHGIIITDHNYDALSSVADNLFVIADGYTTPVRSREDRDSEGLVFLAVHEIIS